VQRLRSYQDNRWKRQQRGVELEKQGNKKFGFGMALGVAVGMILYRMVLG
jgi:hypothetical protein